MKAKTTAEQRPQLNEEVLRARAEHHRDTIDEIEGPLDEALRLADMTMQWWDMHTEKFDMKPLGRPGVHFSQREIDLVGFALSEIWLRLKGINERVDTPFTGVAARCPVSS